MDLFNSTTDKSKDYVLDLFEREIRVGNHVIYFRSGMDGQIYVGICLKVLPVTKKRCNAKAELGLFYLGDKRINQKVLFKVTPFSKRTLILAEDWLPAEKRYNGPSLEEVQLVEKEGRYLPRDL
jgi:hypothetical protein